jgi:bifunctional UDP-N-acetylglucosamine pyrophosphorylase/glucosamine-1-phosphate N-acetyltransferase
VLTNVGVGDGVHIKPYTVATDAVIGDSAQLGPFSHLRPGSTLLDSAHVGNFVELKATSWDAAARPTTWPTWATPRSATA